MKKELVCAMVPNAIREKLEENYDSIMTDMARQMDERDSENAFKFPVSLKITFKPAGDKSRFSLDINWNNPKKISTGDYVMDESNQLDMFSAKKIMENTVAELAEEGVDVEVVAAIDPVGDEPAELLINKETGEVLEKVEDKEEPKSDLDEVFKKAPVNKYPDWVITKKDKTPHFKAHSYDQLVQFLGLYPNHFIGGSVRSTMKIEDLITAMEVNYVGWPLPAIPEEPGEEINIGKDIANQFKDEASKKKWDEFIK